MFKGKINSEALNNPTVINDLEVIEFHIEHHPEADAKFWHCFKVNVPDSKIGPTTKKISKKMKHGWFVIFWNEAEIFVVFSGKVFNLPRDKKSKPTKWREAIDYGINHGVQEEYLDFEKEIDF